MLRTRGVAIAASFIVLLFASVSLAAIPVKVPLGKGTVLTLKDSAKRISLSNSDIADVNLISPQEILINGKKEGSTNLIIWDAKGKREFFDVIVYRERGVSYERETIDALENEIRALGDGTNVTVEQVGDTLVLKGTARNRLTVDKIEKISLLYAPKGCRGISRDFSLENNLPKPKSTEGSQVELKGGGAYVPVVSMSLPPEQAPVQQEAEKKGEVRESLCLLNLITLPEPQQVVLEVKVAQVDRNALRNIGVSFIAKGRTAEGFSNLVGAPIGGSIVESSSSFGNTTTSTSQSGTGIAGNVPGLGTYTPLDAFQLGASYFPGGVGAVLKALATKNLAKVLAEPNLLVKSGQEGSFLAGSKIPISVVSGVGAVSGTTIQFIDVGIKLNFKPDVLESGMISLKIDPAEVSSITGTLAVNGYPIIDTREVHTDVELKEGESLILAGLLQEEAIKTMSKIPLLGDIPILGALFRSTQDDIRDKELVFFITPRLVKPTAKGVKTELPTDKPVPPELERDLRWIP